MYRDRGDAGKQLAALLAAHREDSPVVLALPRGGVPVGYEVARLLRAPLDLVLVRKIGAPFQPELAVGAVVDGAHSQVVVNHDVVESLQIPRTYVEEEAARQLEEIERRRALYLAGRERIDPEGKTAIVVDDGIATGATVRAALRATRQARPARLILAVPVAPAETVASLRGEADEVVCPYTPEPFGAIGYFYADFAQLSDAEVVDLLRRAASDTIEPADPEGRETP